jgi:nitroreductase
MDFQDVVRGRRMVRDYEARPVPEEVRERILANALRAPSAGHLQGWAFLVVEEPRDRERFWAAVTSSGDESPGRRGSSTRRSSWWRGRTSGRTSIATRSRTRA